MQLYSTAQLQIYANKPYIYAPDQKGSEQKTIAR